MKGGIDWPSRVGVPSGPPLQNGRSRWNSPRWTAQVAWIADKTHYYTRFGSAIAVGANASTWPGGTSFSVAKTANLPKIHLGCRTDNIHQVDIDIGGPFTTGWAQVDPGGFFRAPTWWSPTGQKKLSNMPWVLWTKGHLQFNLGRSKSFALHA